MPLFESTQSKEFIEPVLLQHSFVYYFKYHFVLESKKLMWFKAITLILITLIRIVCPIRIIGQPGCEEGFLILNNSPATSQLMLSVWWCCCSILAELFGNLPFALTDLFQQLLISFITCWSVFFLTCWLVISIVDIRDSFAARLPSGLLEFVCEDGR